MEAALASAVHQSLVLLVASEVGRRRSLLAEGSVREEKRHRAFFFLGFDLAIHVRVAAARRTEGAQPDQSLEDVFGARADDVVDLPPDRLGRDIDAYLHRLEFQVLLGEVLLLLEQHLHLLRETESCG